MIGKIGEIIIVVLNVEAYIILKNLEKKQNKLVYQYMEWRAIFIRK